MCSIIGSSNREYFKKLYNLNAYRGALSHSLCALNVNGHIEQLAKDYGELTEDNIESFNSSFYFLGHSQAPTTESKNVHPAVNGGQLLWHNGIIKQGTFEGEWDTQWMLDNIIEKGFGFLSDVDGSFACVYHNTQNLFIFRNEISPLFVDAEFNISSTKFNNSTPVPPNKVYQVTFVTTDRDTPTVRLNVVAEFKTKENPYYFDE